MKKAILFSLLLASSYGFSQDKSGTTTTTTTTTTTVTSNSKSHYNLKNEFRGDPLFLIFGGILNLDYERLLNEESGVGVNLFIAPSGEINTQFSIAPYYRFYFGEKPAAGFFFEGFTQFSSFESDIQTQSNNFSSYKTETFSDLAVGIGLGGKWITRRGIVFELSAGVGRNMFNDYSNHLDRTNVTGKGGFSVGYRF